MSSSFISKHNKGLQKVWETKKLVEEVMLSPVSLRQLAGQSVCQQDYKEKTEPISTKRARRMGLGTE